MSSAIAKNKTLTFDQNGLSINGDFICSWHSDFIRNCLVEAKKFYFRGKYYNYTAHKDCTGYWTASKRLNGRLYKKRLGDTFTINLDKCCQAHNYFDEKDNILSQTDKQYILKIESLNQKIKMLEDENQYLRKQLRMER